MYVIALFQVTVFSLLEYISYRDVHMKKQCLTKPIWKSVIGANPEAKQHKLQADNYGLFSCPVHFCEHGRYVSKRGCRKCLYETCLVLLL